MQAPSSPYTANATPPLFWWVLGGSLVLALIPTLWPALDLQAAALFAGPDALLHSGAWWWVELINQYVPAVFRAVLVLAFVGWLLAYWRSALQAWRLPLAFVVLAGIVGPGAVVNLGFKDHWQRARPYQVQEFGGTQRFTRAAVITDQCDNNCSFVSGHVACGFFWVTLMLVQRRRQLGWAASGLLAGWVIGFARMSDVAHWLSDVLWAGPITLLSSWLVWQVLLRVYPAPPTAD